jgi:hypothetical protein
MSETTIARQSQDRAEHSPLRNEFPLHIPASPYCSNDLKSGIFKLRRSAALGKRFIQLNDEHICEWLTFDVDRAGAYYADDDANLPPPNVVTVNPANGHAHLDYLLATPAHKHSASRIEPLQYLSSIQRGMTNRLGADKRYVGLISKNPAHSDWLVEWRRDQPYTFDELNDWLFEDDKRFDPRPREQFGLGRNCTTFDELRTFAYREVLKFKSGGGNHTDFANRLEAVALGINMQFVTPLSYSEVRATARSVAKWTWQRFSSAKFSAIQSHRGKLGMAKRWAGHTAENTTKPWLALGISRRTYYNRKKAGAL